ncbi:TonB-dependent receptor [Chitinophaga alhagiae]|uniref:TonB-dependent receptor n=1 Tax=Chitinophaga alhagiae TaxID=2203219 RepID=UPI000E5C1EB3|nr:TonB-dependent receptor [Chitinophaga alhagiae]
MKTFCIFFLLAITASYNAFSQQIIGRVTDKNGHPLEGAGVAIAGTVDGATTDSTGAFRFQTRAGGALRLQVSYLGYKTREMPIQAGIPVTVKLERDPATLEPVVVSAGSFMAGDKSKGAVMTAMDVVSVAGNGGDVANAVRTLPGAQQIGEREGLFVRGGTGLETRQFIDGTLVPQPYFASLPGLPQFNRISSPFLFDGIVFSSGGYSALYGQGLSGALVLETQDLPDKSSAVIGISPMVAVAGVQRLAPNKRSSFSLNTRYMTWEYYARLVPQNPEYAEGPAYSITEANLRAKTGKTGLLKVYANFGYHHAGLYRKDVDSTALRNGFMSEDRNLYVNISHRSTPGKHLRLDLAGAFNHNATDIRKTVTDAFKHPVHIPHAPYLRKEGDSSVTDNFAQARAVLSRYFPGNQVLRAGGEVQLGWHDELYAAFAEMEWTLTTSLALRTGLRFEHSRLLRDAVLAPRLSLAYRLGNGSQLNAAYGVFYQKADNPYLLAHPEMPQARATHYILNYLRHGNNRLFRAELFYKQYDRLLKTTGQPAMNGSGHAEGFEFFWRDKKSIPLLDYWVSYSYLHTKREHLNYPGMLAPSFAAPHTLSVVAKRFFEPIRTSVNLSYAYAAGRPYYDISATGQLRDKGTTKAYSVLNLSLAHMLSLFPQWKEKDFTVIAFGVNNVLGTKQVFGYEYSFNGANKVPLTLPATRNFFIGIFMSLGIDRTEDYLNENL